MVNPSTKIVDFGALVDYGVITVMTSGCLCAQNYELWKMLHDISIKDGFYDEIFSDLHIFTFLVLRNLSHQVLRNDEI